MSLSLFVNGGVMNESVRCFYHIPTQVTVRLHKGRLIRANLLAAACIFPIAPLPLVGANSSHLSVPSFSLKFERKNAQGTNYQSSIRQNTSI